MLYKVVNTESEAKELAESKAEVGFVSWGMEATDTGWSHTRSLKGDEGKYIVFYFIRYDENGGYKSEYGYGKIQANGGNIETTKAPETTTTKVAETTTKAPETTTKISETTTKVLETTKPAAGDSKYESLNYKDIANNNNGEFDKGLLGCKYAVISGEINACLFQNKGFSELYMAVGGMGAGNFKATINGRNVTKTQGTGVFMNPASDFLTYKYNVVEISSDDGTATVIILNPNKTGTYNQTTPETTTKSQETTTKAPETTTKSQETTTKAPETTTKKQEQTTKAPETTTKSQETTTKAPETTTKKQEQTTKAPETTKKQEQTTKAPETTKSQQTDNNNTITTDAKNTTTAGNSEGINGTSAEKTALGRAAFSKKIKKKLSLKKIKVSIKKVENATGYEVRVATSKKFKKTLYKKSYKKVAFTLKSKKLANKKKLYIKVRAYVLDGTNKIYGKWSKVKKVKIK